MADEPLKPPIRRLLLICQNWLGDALFSTPAIRALRKAYPHLRISCLCDPRVADIFLHNPHVDEVIPYEQSRGPWSFVSAAALALRLKSGGYDAALFFRASRSLAWACVRAGIPLRAGFASGKDPDLTMALSLSGEASHRVDHFLALARFMGAPAHGSALEYRVQPDEEASALRVLADAGGSPTQSYAVVHAGGNWDLKRWPEERFSEWIRRYVSQTQDQVVLCGTASEAPLIGRIRRSAASDRIHDLCGRTSTAQLAALLRKARLLLSNDSGPIHLAASQGTPIVGLFGPTVPGLTGPVSEGPLRVLWTDVGCEVPCYFRSCDHRFCMDVLSVDRVLREAEAIAR